MNRAVELGEGINRHGDNVDDEKEDQKEKIEN